MSDTSIFDQPRKIAGVGMTNYWRAYQALLNVKCDVEKILWDIGWEEHEGESQVDGPRESTRICSTQIRHSLIEELDKVSTIVPEEEVKVEVTRLKEDCEWLNTLIERQQVISQHIQQASGEELERINNALRSLLGGAPYPPRDFNIRTSAKRILSGLEPVLKECYRWYIKWTLITFIFWLLLAGFGIWKFI